MREEPVMSYLQCETCGLIYSHAAIAREMTLSTGVDCRRCSGTLKLEVTDESPPQRRPVIAVRSAVTGQERLPFC
jgi:DNA-directed RNA polymerase subunit RPC12/RpoP